MLLTPLKRSFFEPSAEVIAPALLGMWLIRNTETGPCGGPIVESEAYLTGDPASHAFGGETTRNRVMWGPPGFGYVYLIYGNHSCVNAVCSAKGVAEAVLIRAIEPALNPEWMLVNRPVKALRELTSGPGKLCQALKITRALDGVDLCDGQSPLYIARHPERNNLVRKTGPIVTTHRVGITKAATLPLRFYLENSAFVSRK